MLLKPLSLSFSLFLSLSLSCALSEEEEEEEEQQQQQGLFRTEAVSEVDALRKRRGHSKQKRGSGLGPVGGKAREILPPCACVSRMLDRWWSRSGRATYEENGRP
jgi:hypothetical protein